MTAYIIRRLWQMIPTLLGVILLVFVLFNWIGGDPAYVLAGKISSAEQIENIRRQLGVDQPYYVQLWIFIKQVLTADFGASWSTNEAVSHIMATRLGPSLTVLIPLLILSTIIAIGLALGVAYVRGSLTDRVVMIVCTVGLSISILVYIIVFQYFFAYKLGWFPVQGWGDSFWQNLVVYASLPVLIGLVVSIAPDLRLFRTFVLDSRFKAGATVSGRTSSCTRRCPFSSGSSSASHPTCACSAPSFSMRSIRITCARRVQKGFRKTASCGCTCSATRRFQSSRT